MTWLDCSSLDNKSSVDSAPRGTAGRVVWIVTSFFCRLCLLSTHFHQRFKRTWSLCDQGAAALGWGFPRAGEGHLFHPRTYSIPQRLQLPDASNSKHSQQSERRNLLRDFGLLVLNSSQNGNIITASTLSRESYSVIYYLEFKPLLLSLSL